MRAFTRLQNYTIAASLTDKSVSVLWNLSFTLLGVCALEPVAGRCRAAIIRWYYDSTTQRCRTFIYGGCDGNENNFSNEPRCTYFCTGQLLLVKSHPPES